MKNNRRQRDQRPTVEASGPGATAAATVTAMSSRVRRGLRLFTSAQDEPRARRSTDVILLAISFVGIVFVGLVAIPEPGFSRAVTSFLGSLPNALTGMWQVFADSPTVWALVVLVAAFTRSRAKVGRDMILAIVVGIVLWLLRTSNHLVNAPDCSSSRSSLDWSDVRKCTARHND